MTIYSVFNGSRTLTALMLICACSVSHAEAKQTGKTGGWRLAAESSPYLNMHADNPVEWYPWGPEAFEKARRENKPLFISIGYFTCHWCHVMARESFENPEIAVVAFVYNGGEGSSVAGPIVRRVMEAYFELKAIDTGIQVQ